MLRCFPELIAAREVDVLPSYGRYLLEADDRLVAALVFAALDKLRDEAGIVVDDAVGDKPAPLAPKFLLDFSLEAQPAEVGERYRPAQLVIVLAPIERRLHVAPQRRGVEIVEQIDTSDDVVIFPQGTPSRVRAGVSAELIYDDMLAGSLERERYRDALNVVPFVGDERLVEFANRFEERVGVMTRVLKTVQRRSDLVVDVLVTGRESVTEEVEQREVDLIGIVRAKPAPLGLVRRGCRSSEPRVARRSCC